MSDNWKVFAKKFVGKTDDGKMSGNMRVGLAVFSLAMIATATYAATTIWQGYNGDAVKGTCKFVSDDAGATTLTVDKVVAASGVTAPLSGAVTATTLSASSTTTLTNVTIRPSAVVTFGASGTITNATIIGSTIGSVVPLAGSFTTLGASGVATLSGGGTLTGTFTGGTFTNATLNHCKESIGSMYLMAGPSASQSWGMEAGTKTLVDNGAGLFTNTYTYVRTYAAAPFPVASYAAAVGNVTNVFTTGQTTNCLISGGAAVAVNVIVTGRIE